MEPGGVPPLSVLISFLQTQIVFVVMDRMFVVKSLQYRPEDAADASWTRVDDLGFSVVRLMQLSGREATGVRADLQIQDQDALNTLARHYAENTRLEWWFKTGGGGGAFAVVLRWTKFDRLTGTLQVVRTAVLRDLISEAEDSATSSADDAPRTAEQEASSVPSSEEREETQAGPVAEPPASSRSNGLHVAQTVSDLWPKLLGEDGGLKSRRSNRG